MERFDFEKNSVDHSGSTPVLPVNGIGKEGGRAGTHHLRTTEGLLIRANLICELSEGTPARR